MRTSSQFWFGVRPAAETPGPLSWRQAAMGAGAAHLSAVLLFAVVFFPSPGIAVIPGVYLLALAPVGGVIGYPLARVFGSRGPLALRLGVFAVAGGVPMVSVKLRRLVLAGSRSRCGAWRGGHRRVVGLGR